MIIFFYTRIRSEEGVSEEDELRQEAADLEEEFHTQDLLREGVLGTYSPLSGQDLVMGRARVPPFLFSGFLRRNSLTMIGAEPFVGKTMLLLYLALCLEMEKSPFGLY